MGDAMGNYRVGCNFFDLVFDLSYRRHGALLVYDPDHKVLKEVTNKGAVIKEGTNSSDKARALLRPALSNIAMGGKALRERKKRLFFEIASVDGAVIFDRDQILAFGAIINSHPEAGDHYGARTTAAFSAFKWGGKPVKVSADGDITFIFKSGSGRETCDARIEFL